MISKYDFHIHVETAEATPFAALEVIQQNGLVAGLVDHVFADRNRITSDVLKAECRERFGATGFIFGCEADAFGPGKVALPDSLCDTMDFIIVSCTHFGQPGVLDGVDINKPVEVAGRVMALLRTAVEWSGTDVLGHPFAFPDVGVDPEAIVREIDRAALIAELRRVAEKRIAVEINSRTLRRLPVVPQRYFLKAAVEAGCVFTIGSDAHALDEVGRTEEALELVSEFSIPEKSIVRPDWRK